MQACVYCKLFVRCETISLLQSWNAMTNNNDGKNKVPLKISVYNDKEIFPVRFLQLSYLHILRQFIFEKNNA